jgi:hypothetical protein
LITKLQLIEFKKQVEQLRNELIGYSNKETEVLKHELMSWINKNKEELNNEILDRKEFDAYFNRY